jgi:hypothetical protein
MNSVSRYLVSPIVDRGANNDKASGGLPHSEISGSKPIPGSPKLIAGYHVLHRLLLPRHPPNALLALDPIQRRTGLQGAPLCSAPAHPPRLHRRSPDRKSYSFPPSIRVRMKNNWLVYLTWNKPAFRPRNPAPAPDPPHSEDPAGLMFLSLHDCQIPSGSDGRTRMNRALQSDPQGPGGSRRTRTSDLTLIRRAL